MEIPHKVFLKKEHVKLDFHRNNSGGKLLKKLPP